MGTVAPFRLRNGAVYHFRDDCQFSQEGVKDDGTGERRPCDECIRLVQKDRTDMLAAG